MNVIVPSAKRTTTKTHSGFSIPLQPDTDLGSAILIAEDEEGTYEPIAVAINIREGKQLAQSDLRERLRRLEHDEDPGICPWQYRLWARGVDGQQRVAATWLAAQL